MSKLNILCCLVVLFFIVLIVNIIFKCFNKDKRNKYINKLAEKFDSIIIDTINDVNIDKMENIIYYERACICNIFNALTDYIKTTSLMDLQNKEINQYVYELITIKYIKKYIDNYISINNIPDKITNNYNAYNFEKINIEKEDEKLIEEYSNEDLYYDKVDDNDLEEAKPIIPTAEDINNLNPPIDEEEEFNIEDDSMEIITDKKVLISVKDKNGNDLYYEINNDGKKKRVSKKYYDENKQ